MTTTPAIIQITTASGSLSIVLERPLDGDPLHVVGDLIEAYKSNQGQQWGVFNNERRALLMAEYLLNLDFDGQPIIYAQRGPLNQSTDWDWEDKHVYTFQFRSIGLPEVTVQGPGSTSSFSGSINELILDFEETEKDK